jgi:hypothetical protein
MNLRERVLPQNELDILANANQLSKLGLGPGNLKGCLSGKIDDKESEGKVKSECLIKNIKLSSMIF